VEELGADNLGAEKIGPETRQGRRRRFGRTREVAREVRK
jgi:hypothetical protein